MKNYFQDKKIVIKHAEYFYIIKTSKKKIEIRSLSCLSGYDLEKKSKGPKLKLDKKNLDSKYIFDYDEGVNLIDSTHKYFSQFENKFTANFELKNFDQMIDSFISKTTCQNTERFIFLETRSKLDFLKQVSNNENYSYLDSVFKHVIDLDSKRKKLVCAKNIYKIPVSFLFYKRNDLICFSMCFDSFSLETKLAILSR